MAGMENHLTGQGAEAQPAPIPGLAIGQLCHYVGSQGRHEASVIIEIVDAASGYVKLRNLYTLCTDTCTYSEVPMPDTWHWIERG